MSKLCGVLARQYVDFLSGAPRLILLLAITVCGLCIPSVSRFLSSTQNVYSEIAGSRSAVAREKMKEYFGHLPPESDLILVQQQREEAFAPSPNLVSSGLLVEISTMTQDFLQSRGFSDIEVDSYPVFQEQGFPHIASQLVSEDLRSALLVLRRIGVPINKTVGALESDLILELRRRYLDVSDSSLAYIGVAGIAPFVVDGSRSAAKDLARSNPICIPLCFMVLAFVVQSWRLMLITLLCMICANTVCFACLSWMADSGVVMSTSVPIMGESCLMALTFDYSLFLLVRFQEEIAIGMTHQGAVTAYPQVFDPPPGLELPWTQMHLEAMEDPVRAAGPMAPMAPIGPMGPMGPVLPRPRPAAPSLSYCEAQNFCEAKRGFEEAISMFLASYNPIEVAHPSTTASMASVPAPIVDDDEQTDCEASVSGTPRGPGIFSPKFELPGDAHDHDDGAATPRTNKTLFVHGGRFSA